VKSPIPWPGGKFYLIPKLLKLIPDHSVYVEPFSGGASLLFAKEPAKVEVLNDVDGELINFFQVVQQEPKKLLKGLRWKLHSRRWFLQLRDEDPNKLDPVDRAVRFYYLVKSSFSSKQVSFSVGKKTNPARKHISTPQRIRDAHSRLQPVIIEELDFCECIQRYDDPKAFIYLDPPYRQVGKKIYTHPLKDGDFVRLRNLLQQVKGKWLLSHSDDGLIRELFRDFEIREVETRYSMANGRNPNYKRRRTELLVANYPIKGLS